MKRVEGRSPMRVILAVIAVLPLAGLRGTETDRPNIGLFFSDDP